MPQRSILLIYAYCMVVQLTAVASMQVRMSAPDPEYPELPMVRVFDNKVLTSHACCDWDVRAGSRAR